MFFIGDLSVQMRVTWKVMIIDWNLPFKALSFATKNKQYIVIPLVDEITAPLIIDSVLHVGSFSVSFHLTALQIDSGESQRRVGIRIN